MTKAFYEVFTKLTLDKESNDMMDGVMVTKITSTKRKDRIRIYIESNHLITKQVLLRIEDEIKKQVFEEKVPYIYIIEHYQLSDQYTGQTLYATYKDSIFFELQKEDMLLYSIIRGAKITFPTVNHMHLVVSNSLLVRKKEDEILQVLHQIFKERCGVDVTFDMEYQSDDRTKNISRQDELLKRKVQKMVADVDNNRAKSSEDGGEEKQRSNGKRKPMSRTSWGRKKTDNPDVIYGQDFDEESTELREITTEMGEVVIRGQIRTAEFRPIKNEKTIIKLFVTDFTDTIGITIFAHNNQVVTLKENLLKGSYIKIKGIALINNYDKELGINSVVGIKKIPDFTNIRMDTAIEKRVELHCHTKMSDMDAVSDVKDIIKRAKAWGHKALAVTDHGCVQAFPDANHAVDPSEDFKVLYGVEGYFVDDSLHVVTNDKGQRLKDTFVVFDLETTGLSATRNRIIEIGAVKFVDGKEVGRFSEFVNPRVPIPYFIEKLTSISDDMVLDADPIEVVLPKFLEFSEGAVFVAHNADFDMGFVLHNAQKLGIEVDATYLDTVSIARKLIPDISRFRLNNVAKKLGVSLENHHRAVDDASCTAEIFMKFMDRFYEAGYTLIGDLKALEETDANIVKKLPTYHGIIIAKNEIGRVNLYRLISESHINYFAKRPRIPKSLLEQYREGLIVGSACEAGELYQGLLHEKSNEEIASIIDFYDYLEIQPVGNNAFLLRGDDPIFQSVEELQEVNRKIVKLGEEFHKPVVATCDVHFLDPEDEIYRRIIMTGKGFKDADEQPPLYLHTTDEMLQEFSYLGTKKAFEVVVTNTNKIANQCDRISPVRPDKCPPVIANSDSDLRRICYTRAHEMYGEDLPSVVTERLERELNSIISNGFAVMYIIAQKLVWKSNEDGYLVGSRGSVGSSFVATMAGITEVNPLRPHYYCEKCHYSDFDSEDVMKYGGKSGCDMPDKKCPECGAKLIKDGFDIPFETFLGFKGNKEPDIDLNFSGEYQSKAHKYTEVIFGEGQTFRAGTIAALAEKTAYGYVKNYFEEKGEPKRNAEVERILSGCVGVRRSTGQHPGGIIVLPFGEEIYSFTPIQRPANDMTTTTITTHFDYHSIDHNLLKLDILGHDDPTMIRMLEDITNVEAMKIPLDDEKVMSLFSSTQALGITPADIGGTELGTLGIPEFGTDFVIQMLKDTQPQSFSDLIRISGLSHGTDVWLGNAQTLIQEGKATISTSICTRDDIMVYLISKGLESELSFTIMEAVRKGKGLKEEWEVAMKEHGVPDWYIWSCKKIKYMFPKAHAAAYVMMAWRIAYFKVYYPKAYYAAYFSIRASAFSYELMCQGQERLEYYMKDYMRRKDELSKKEQDTLKDMRNVQEMYARGIEFCKMDIYQASANRMKIIDGKLMPPLSSLDGLGGSVAEAVVEAVKDGKFLSKEDLRNRTKLSKNTISLMSDLGILDDMPNTNQLSLFDGL